MKSLNEEGLIVWSTVTFFNPPEVTNSLLALASWGTTLENWPNTCLRIFGGASWSKGSRAGRCKQWVSIFLSAFLDYKHTINRRLGRLITSYLLHTLLIRFSEELGLKYRSSKRGRTLALATARACSAVWRPICPRAHEQAAYEKVSMVRTIYLYGRVIIPAYDLPSLLSKPGKVELLPTEI